MPPNWADAKLLREFINQAARKTTAFTSCYQFFTSSYDSVTEGPVRPVARSHLRLCRCPARHLLPRITIITMNILYRMLLNGMPLRGALVAVALSLATVAALGALTIRAVPIPHSQLPDVSQLQLEMR
jgi:hypothetical protein